MDYHREKESYIISSLKKRKEEMGLFYDYFMLLYTTDDIKEYQEMLDRLKKRNKFLKLQCAQCKLYDECDNCLYYGEISEILQLITKLIKKIDELKVNNNL